MVNILHLFTDQQRFDTIGALANPHIQTPHLDRLAREGMAFTSAYTPAPECVPARCCMITGRYADKTGCGSNAEAMPSPDAVPSFMSQLAEGGYRTHGIGKCHFTPDAWAGRGFQSRDTSEEIAEDPDRDAYLQHLTEKGYGHVLEPHGARGEMYYIPQPSQLPAELHHSHWTGDRAIDFIDAQRRAEQPWYLYCGFIHPHPPFAPPGPWHKLYRAPDMPLPYLPDNAEELLCYINRYQNRYKYRDRGLDLNLIRCIRAYYFACISFIDYQVGRILEALEASGQLDNTLIVYSADHGELLGDFGSFGKRSFHDASLRVPLLARLPGSFAAGKRCQTPASLVDLMPTFLTAAGMDVPAEADGVDLAALARGEPTDRTVFFHYGSGENAILGGLNQQWKYAWSSPDQRDYLFDRNCVPEACNAADKLTTNADAQALKTAVLQRASEHVFSRTCLNDAGAWKAQEVKYIPADPDEGLLFQDPPKAKPVLPPGYHLDYPAS